MTNQQILTRAIEKAIASRWTNYGHYNNWVPVHIYGAFMGIAYSDDDTAGTLRINDIIFNHDFAKALWGEEPSPYGKVWQRIEPGKGVEYAVQNGYVPAWQYHLQQMVIAKDPIAYLGEHLG